ncbi:hypothetical protein KZZ52_16375 [Dactylosporangium sp. AC04546]|uniref:hypothetical protein n=1 Tax=Dactylosporangium sp. AC04546 TaxID=2862460 RepID=UPI001EDE3807|nr:hypothetical protein [Dactylosporangium sp. AC04546]WVK86879.1 hypothetical protein KZZ52_16375 [Dactylosporangium sp. AC04546]
MVTDEELQAARRPRDVVDVAGSWIAGALATHGFHWLARTRTVQRQAGSLLHQIALHPSSYNRTDRLVSVSTYVGVRDPAFRRWRLAHPHLVAPPRDHDFVCGHLLGYASGRANGYLYGDAQDGDIDLTEPAERAKRLKRFVAMLEEGVLPWFTEASDPDLIVNSRAGDYTNNPVALMEWLAYQDRIDLVHSYAERYQARHPGTEQRWTHGAAAATAGRMSPHGGDTAAAMGWCATILTANPTGSG